jgi:hypothetical protein
VAPIPNLVGRYHITINRLERVPGLQQTVQVLKWISGAGYLQLKVAAKYDESTAILKARLNVLSVLFAATARLAKDAFLADNTGNISVFREIIVLPEMGLRVMGLITEVAAAHEVQLRITGNDRPWIGFVRNENVATVDKVDDAMTRACAWAKTL